MDTLKGTGSSTQSRPSRSRERGGSFLRQAGQALAGDIEFENFRCIKVTERAKAGDGQLGVDGKHATEFGACLVEPAEMRQRDDFGPHSHDRAGLVMQGAVGPFDRLFEAPRDEMSDSDISGVAKGGMPIERAQTARPFDGFDRRLGLVAHRVDNPSGRPGAGKIEPALARN